MIKYRQLKERVLIMEEKDLSQSFIDLGFTIENPYKFMQEMSANKIEPLDLLNKLVTLQNQANSNATIVDFSKTMLGRIQKLDTELKSDELFHKSDENVLKNVKNDISNIIAHFDAIKAYLNAQENANLQKANLLKIKKQIYTLTQNQNMPDEKRTNQTLDLQSRLKTSEEAYKNALQEQERCKKEYNNKIGSTKVEDFKNELLEAINSLSKNCQNLALGEETRNSINATIVSMRNTTAYYALDNIKSQNEFDALCSKYHLKYDESKVLHKKDSTPITPKNIDKEETVEEKHEHTESATKKQEQSTSTPDAPAESDETINKEQELDTPTQDTSKSPDESATKDDVEFLTEEEPKIKVIAKRACKWLNKHKKQILIGVGISLLIVATIVAIQYLLPAITSMIKASEVANLSMAMVNNGAAWHAAIASEQAALHSANTALASAIQTITGNQALFNIGSGVWTIGGTELGHFTAGAIATAAKSTAVVSSLSNALLGLGIGGLGTTALGALLPQNKSEKYIELRKKIRKLNRSYADISHEETIAEVENIIAEIKASNLNIDEQNRLINKAQKIINQSKTYDKVDEKIENLTGGRTR